MTTPFFPRPPSHSLPPSTTSLKVLPLRSSPRLFSKLPISELLNSPACVRVWRGEGSIAHRLTNPAVRTRGSTSAEPLPGSPSLVYFSQQCFFFFLPFFRPTLRVFTILRCLVSLPSQPAGQPPLSHSLLFPVHFQ